MAECDECGFPLEEGGHELCDVEQDPFLDLPFGEQQHEVDYLETRYESEPEPFEWEGPWDY